MRTAVRLEPPGALLHLQALQDREPSDSRMSGGESHKVASPNSTQLDSVCLSMHLHHVHSVLFLFRP